MSSYKEKIMELCKEVPNEYALALLNRVKTYEKKVIFGGGACGSSCIGFLKQCDIDIDYFCDNNLKFRDIKIRGVEYISPNDLLKIKEKMIVIIAVRKYQDIYEQLMAIGIEAENIAIVNADILTFQANYFISSGQISVLDLCRSVCSVVDVCEDELSAKILYQTLKRYILNPEEIIENTGKAYFIPEVGKRKQEVFVDVGAYNGDTLDEFLREYNNSFERYYAFELNIDNYKNLCSRVEKIPDFIRNKIAVYNIGLWSEKAEIKYNSNDAGTSIASYGECKGVVDKLDNILKEKVTYIKMDIEGAEIAALKGSMGLLHKYRPTCAICVYHSINDIIKIPIMLKELGYRIIIRHHETNASEIVCYAYE